MSMDSAMEEISAEAERHQATLEKYVDQAMYEAAPMQEAKVVLLWMTPDPLGAIAAACRMYEGKPTYSLADVTDEERRRYFEDVQKTHLLAPMEFVKFHFFIEGVDRSFTHQHVRQRTAVFAQESLRFAVKDNMAEEVVLPPSMEALPPHHPTRQMYDKHMQGVQDFYNYLIGNNVPAEDARSILPHAVSTRLNYCTDLRNLLDHAGNRLCTQAQLHWRRVFEGIREAILNYEPDFSWLPAGLPMSQNDLVSQWEARHRWQFELLGSSNLFKPKCYQLGHCPFQASFDRGCTIRGRVEANASIGRHSSEWDEPAIGDVPPVELIPAIQDSEWLLDRKAAWL